MWEGINKISAGWRFNLPYKFGYMYFFNKVFLLTFFNLQIRFESF